jgi:heme/copper-type cytochrome/quinol oxidase subunit 2
VTALSTGIPAALAAGARAAGLLAADWKYWLPPNYSMHGGSIDMLFVWIFWITTIIFFVVEITLVVFLIKYRQRPNGRRAVFTHGNTRLEMTWTLAPAVILIILALATKRVWDRYRYSKDADDPDRAQVLVVGEQFKWNFVFPGPDGHLGTYLAYPKPGDPQYRGMSYPKALGEIGKYIENDNPLGQKIDRKNPADPGLDDDYAPKSLARRLILPVGRAIDLNLTAKDVLHDFFLPTFRVKLDAVPGMRGHIVFRAKPEAQSTRRVPLDQVAADDPLWLDPETPGVTIGGNPKSYRIYDPTGPKTGARRVWLGQTPYETLGSGARRRLARQGPGAADDPQKLAAEVQKFKADLRGLGVTDLTVVGMIHEIVCEELCGQGHTTMKGEMLVVSPQEYAHFLNLTARTTPTTPTRPAPQPVAAASPSVKE